MKDTGLYGHSKKKKVREFYIFKTKLFDHKYNFLFTCVGLEVREKLSRLECLDPGVIFLIKRSTLSFVLSISRISVLSLFKFSKQKL